MERAGSVGGDNGRCIHARTRVGGAKLRDSHCVWISVKEEDGERESVSAEQAIKQLSSYTAKCYCGDKENKIPEVLQSLSLSLS